MVRSVSDEIAKYKEGWNEYINIMRLRLRSQMKMSLCKNWGRKIMKKWLWFCWWVFGFTGQSFYVLGSSIGLQINGINRKIRIWGYYDNDIANQGNENFAIVDNIEEINFIWE